jgi:hypothetical protein
MVGQNAMIKESKETLVNSKRKISLIGKIHLPIGNKITKV